MSILFFVTQDLGQILIADDDDMTRFVLLIVSWGDLWQLRVKVKLEDDVDDASADDDVVALHQKELICRSYGL